MPGFPIRARLPSFGGMGPFAVAAGGSMKAVEAVRYTIHNRDPRRVRAERMSAGLLEQLTAGGDVRPALAWLSEHVEAGETDAVSVRLVLDRVAAIVERRDAAHAEAERVAAAAQAQLRHA